MELELIFSDFGAMMCLCLKSKMLMLPQESMVCSSLPFLFLIEQMEKHNLADLTKDDAPHSAVRDKRQIVHNSANRNNNKCDTRCSRKVREIEFGS